MLDIAGELEKVLEAGERVALATVVRTRGSTPRSLGTQMAIRAGGQHLGTVGGGCGEAEVIRKGLTVLDDGVTRTARADMTDEATEETESACGGIMDVLVTPFGADLLPVVRAVKAAHERRHKAILAVVTTPEEAAGSMVVAEIGQPGRWPARPIAWAGPGLDSKRAASVAKAAFDELGREREAGETAGARGAKFLLGGQQGDILAISVELPRALIICGGGHIALPLCQMAKVMGYAVTVIDDRPSFANTGRFHHADRVICLPFDQALKDHPLDEDTAVVVVTRGHKHDLESVRSVLGRGAGYVGMIGSRRRVAGARELLQRDGFSSEEVGRLHAPIGLDIGAETPAEIALSILAEIILERRGGSASPLSRQRS